MPYLKRPSPIDGTSRNTTETRPQESNAGAITPILPVSSASSHTMHNKLRAVGDGGAHRFLVIGVGTADLSIAEKILGLEQEL